MIKTKDKKKHILFRAVPPPQGFTLVELMVVIALIGIMATLAIPSFISWVPNYRLKGATQLLYSSFQKARLEAVKRNTNVGISFSTANGTYQVFVDDGTGGGISGNATRDGSESILSQNSLPASCSFIAPSTFVGNITGYNSRALPLGNRTGTIQLRNNLTRQYRLSLSNAGHVKLEISTDNGTSWK